MASFSVHAATITWTNTAGGDWSVAGNWNPNQVPDASDTAVITKNNGLWIAQVTNAIDQNYGGGSFNNSGTFDVQTGAVDISMTGTPPAVLKSR